MSNDKPIVAIVGRPNVGKSCLFNRIVGRKAAVVDDMAGVTRDRHYQETSWNGMPFLMADTGGMVPNAKSGMTHEILKQVDRAIQESALLIFLVDGKIGPVDEDLLIARRLLKEAPGRVILAVNKAESETVRNESGAFFSLGFGEPVGVSALHGTNVGNLLDKVQNVIRRSKTGRAPVIPPDAVKIAILGRPNAGKSSLTNKLLRQERMIVDAVPGTTRDSIDSLLMYDGKPVVLIDTAGLRRKSQVHDDVEHYANLRALESIKRADICVLMVDAFAGFGEQDLKILTKIYEFHKGAVVCFNKWDLVKKDTKTFYRLIAGLAPKYPEIKYAPCLTISALTGQRVNLVIETAFTVRQHMQTKIPSAELRDSFFQWVKKKPHPFSGSKEVRFLGIKQIPGGLPVFRIFAQNHNLVQKAYERYLINNIYNTWDFTGSPLLLSFRRPAKPE